MDNVPELINNIYQVFQNYFGEDRVDLQCLSSACTIKLDAYGQRDGDYVILVHWSDVTVTNEYDESVIIWDLYCATTITPQGELRRPPAFTRSTYDKIQWLSGYCHSHVPSLNRTDCARFRYSCLGRGPINGTIEKLRNQQHEDLDIWNLYCWELDKYVHVESLTGGPFRRLREIGKNAGEGSIASFNVSFEFPFPTNRVCKTLTKSLVKLLVEQNVLKYNYVNGRYMIGMAYPEAVMAISNSFISWYNSNPKIYTAHPKESLFTNNFLEKVFVLEGVIIKRTSDGEYVEMDTGRELFKFKGNPVTLQMHHSNSDYNEGEVNIVNSCIIDYIIYIILRYLNMNYGKSTDSTNKKTRIL